MQQSDSSRIDLGDISDIIGTVLDQRGDELSPQQREELRQRQSQVEEARRGNPSALQQYDGGKEGLLDDILRIAGPVVAGYVIRVIQERLTGDRSAAEAPSGDQERTPPAPQYGTYREGDAVHRSGPGGQSVEEVD